MADRTSILLVLGSGAAIAWGAYEWVRPLSLPEPPPVSVATAPPPLNIPGSYIGEIDAFNEITERPLFTAGRQPAPKTPAGKQQPATDPAKAPTDLSDMRLTAVIMDGDRLTALVEGGGGKSEKLQIGSKLNSWQVNEIQDDRIVLEANGRRQTLEVYRFDAVPVVKKRAPRRPRRVLTRQPRVVPTPPAPSVGPGPYPVAPDDSKNSSKDPAQ